MHQTFVRIRRPIKAERVTTFPVAPVVSIPADELVLVLGGVQTDGTRLIFWRGGTWAVSEKSLVAALKDGDARKQDH